MDDFEALLESHDVNAALTASGRLDPALRSGPGYLRLEGWLSYELGNLEDARKQLEASVEQGATNPHAHALLAAIHMRQGRPERALECAHRAEASGGAYAWLRSMLGVLNHSLGDIEKAQEWFAKALELDPGRSDALESLCSIASAQREWNDLRDVARWMTQHHPNDPKGWSYLGTAEARAGSDEEAERCLVRAMGLSGSSVDSQRDYGSFLVNCGRIEEAKQLLETALRKDSEQALLHTAHAQCLLVLEGSTKAAWREYEWRLRLPEIPPLPASVRWEGEPLPSETLHIVGEQGMGDMLLFARLLPEVKRRCRRIVLELPPPLVPLFRSSEGRVGWQGIEVVPLGSAAAVAGSTRHVSFMSLMEILGPALPPSSAPYLLPSGESEITWRSRMGARKTRLRVALVWSGNPVREDDVLRSIPPAALAPLAKVENVEFVSLQKNAPARYLQNLPLPLLDLTAHVRNFEDSAAILRQCDLLISVDTAAAHLAGACGTPCWVLLPKARDWRWEMAGVIQPWYPEHRSFHVGRNREWLPLLQSVADLLRTAAETE